MKRQNKNAAKRIYSTRNAIFGYLIGLIFPVLAYLSEFLKTRGDFSLNTFQQFHLENPLFWLVDFIPIFVFCIIYFTPQEEHGNWMTSLFKKIDHSNSYEIFKQKTFYESLVNNSPAAIVTMDADQKIISVNPAFTKMFQYTQEEVHLKDLDVTIAADCDLCQAQEFTQTVLQGGNIHGSGKRRRKDGTLIDVEIYGVPIFLEGKRVGVLGMYIDITDHIQSEKIIKESELRYRSLFHDSPISMWEMDFSLVKEWIDALEFNKEDELCLFLEKMSHFETEFSSLIRIIDVNQATLLLYKAYDLEDLRKNFNRIFIEQSIGPMRSTLLALFNGSHQIETEIPQQTLDGMILHTIMRLSLVNGFEKDWSRVHLSVLDITERKWAEERMRFLTMHDSMTGLYNRAYFETELKRISRGRQFPLSVIVCDLDNLKITNDQYGHTAGDAIICKTASILLESFRADDIVARLGGDEFAMIIPNLEEDRVFKIVERLQKNLEQYNRTLLTDDSTHRVNLSIGSATTQNEAEVAELFKLADQRMYREKLKKRASSSEGSSFNKN